MDTKARLFLEEAGRHPLFALYRLITLRGLRRGEACGLRWKEVDLDAGTARIAWQLVQLAGQIHESKPKTDASMRTIALDAETAAILRERKRRQQKERLAVGEAWKETGFVFTQSDGDRLHPQHVSNQFLWLAYLSGLPPIRLQWCQLVSVCPVLSNPSRCCRLRASLPAAWLVLWTTSAQAALGTRLPNNRRWKSRRCRHLLQAGPGIAAAVDAWLSAQSGSAWAGWKRRLGFVAPRITRCACGRRARPRRRACSSRHGCVRSSLRSLQLSRAACWCSSNGGSIDPLSGRPRHSPSPPDIASAYRALQ
ncbi:tyrosine-type recombinase/integrase [Nonomuraea dietziae]|uniref:tyrosine-type recombinase/integrase n=1 Tax=Nonomuraea dietziae TaxID=65515 RepID=UPI00342BB450